MRWLILSVLFVACSGEPGDDPPAASNALPPPRVVTCAPTHQAIGVACVPLVPACAAGEAPTSTGCRAVGVPSDGCATGFVHDGKGACDPVLPAATCPNGLFARPGESSCRAVDVCVSDRYPSLASAVHVDAAYTGTVHDGSADRPYRTITEALAHPDVKAIAIAAGRYVEDLVVNVPIRVAGVCAEKVEIVGSATGSDAAAVMLRAGATLEHVSISGASFGVIVDGAAGARVEAVRVTDTASVGIWVRRGAKSATIADTLVEGAARNGVVVSGSTASIERSAVRGTRFSAGTCAGLQVNPTAVDAPASASVDHSVFETNEGAGVAASGATITMDASVIRDTRSQPDGSWGVGAISEVHAPSKLPGNLELKRSVIERARYFGLTATSSNATLDRVVVRDVQPEAKSGKIGRAVAVQSPSTGLATMKVIDSAILRAHETGIDAVGNAQLSVERTLVRDIRAIGGVGQGLAAVRHDKTFLAPKVSIVDSAIERSAVTGVFSNGTLEVRALKIDESGSFGFLLRGSIAGIRGTVIGRTGGPAVLAKTDGEHPTDLTLEDVVVDGAKSSGVEFKSRTFSASGLWVHDIEADAAGNGGVGLLVSRVARLFEPVATISNCAVERAHGAGIYLAGTTAHLASVVVRDTRALGAGFGDGLVVGAVAFPPLSPALSVVDARDCVFEKNARAGVAVFGSTIDLAESRVLCNPIALNTESTFAITPEGPANAEVSLKNSGGNVCGCETAVECRAQSSGLAPIAASAD